MIRLKPIEHVERRFRIELFIELLVVFCLSCTLSFVLPILIGARSRGVGQIETYTEFLSFLYNKNGHSYPFLLLCGVLGTAIYLAFQLNNKKAIEFIIEETQITIICRNTFSGKIMRNVLKKEDLKVSRKEGSYSEEYYKLFNKEKFIGSFYPKVKPWNLIRDTITIEEIKNLLLENKE